jgi:hypothetical protein
MKILILIVASNQSENESDLKSQKETWIKSCDASVSILYLRGWDKNIYQLNQDVLFVPVKEEYSNILEKTILGMQFALKNFDFDILVRSNVSTYFETKRLVTELNRAIYDGSFVGGYFDKSKDLSFYKGRSFEYISGTGIFLSRDAVVELSQMNPKKYTGIFDDLAIFDFLKNKNFKMVRMARNNLFSTHLFIPTFTIRLKNTHNSKSASKRMFLIHKYFIAENISSRILAYLSVQLNEISEFLSHPDFPFKYLTKNRVVLVSFIKMRINRFRK